MPGIRLAIRPQLVPQSRIHVRVDVAGPQLFGEQLLRADAYRGGSLPKSTITGMFAFVPASTARSTGVHSGPCVMRRLDPDDDVLVAPAPPSAVGLGVHVVQIVLEFPAAHAVADDIQEREHARPRPVDARSLKSSKLRQPEPPASATVVTPTRNVNPSG